MKYKRLLILSLFGFGFAANAFGAPLKPYSNEELIKQSKIWNISAADYNLLYDWDMIAKAGGCVRMHEFETAAKANDAPANLLAGICHRLGINTELSFQKATKYFQVASDLGLGYASVNLAENVLRGVDGKPNQKEAFRLFTLGAARGNVFGIVHAASMELTGKGVAKNPEAAIARVKAASDKGYAIAMTTYASYIEDGNYLPTDGKLAMGLYEKARDLGDRAANIAIANAYFSGKIVEKNEEKAMEIFLENAKKGDAAAMYLYGTMLYNGIGNSRDSKTAIDWIKSAADLGYSSANVFYANALIHGDGIPSDIPKGMALIQEAIKNGENDAMIVLSSIYRTGEYVPKDLQKARDLLQMAHERGSNEATIFLAKSYLNDAENSTQSAKGIELLQEAIRNENLAAFATYADLLLEGKFVKKDEQEALKLLESAANLGEPDAMALLGSVLVTKEGATQKARGLSWLEKAASLHVSSGMYVYGIMLLNGVDGGGNEQHGKELLLEVAKGGSEYAEMALQALMEFNGVSCDPKNKDCNNT